MIAPILTTFRKQYPDIQLELILSDGHIDIINEQIDLAIRHGSLLDSSFITRKLTDVKYHLVSNRKYLNKNGVPQVPQDLKNHDLVTFTYNDFRHYWSFETDDISHNIPVEPVLSTTNASTIRQCVREGLGIALLADWTVLDDLQSGALEEVLTEWRISGTNTGTAIWLVYPSNRFIPEKTKVFTDFLLRSMN